MWALRRIIDLRCGRADVVLRHGQSGALFTAGGPDDEPVRFSDSHAARTFGRRFLDEHEAWEPVDPGLVSTAA